MLNARPSTTKRSLPASSLIVKSSPQAKIFCFIKYLTGLLCVRFLEMGAKDVAIEVVGEIAPDAVHVVRVVLGVVVFEDESGALHPVIVRLPALDPSRPRERERIPP